MFTTVIDFFSSLQLMLYKFSVIRFYSSSCFALKEKLFMYDNFVVLTQGNSYDETVMLQQNKKHK